MQIGAHWHTGRRSAHCATCAGLPQNMHQRLGSLAGAGPKLEALIAMRESVHRDVDYALFRSWRLLWTNTHHYRACRSDSRILGFPLLAWYPQLHTKCANLLFRESFYLAEYEAWQYTEMIIRLPLLIFWGSDPVLICSTGGVSAIHRFRTQL